MERAEIKTAVANLSTRTDLLNLLNKIKRDELGEKAFDFTLKQFNYFCNPNHCQKSYKTFYIPKKSGAPREISAPTKIHKSMLIFANRILQACYEPTASVMGFVPGRSVVDNARTHMGMNYILNLDLKDFFPSISQVRIWSVLQLPPFNMNKDVASAFAGLCCRRVPTPNGKKSKRYNYVLPQGSPASPMLTNIVCRKLDRRLQGLAKRFGLKYTRYADDITFSSFHNVYADDGEFMTELRRIIEGQYFTINEAKTRLQKIGGRQEVTGLIVSDKVNVIRKYVRSLGSLLYIWERYGYPAANASFLKHYTGKVKGMPNMECVLQGKLMYLKMVKGQNDSVYKKLFERYSNLVANLRSRKGIGVDLCFSKKISEYEQESGNRIDFRCKRDTDGNISNSFAVIVSSDHTRHDMLVSLTQSCSHEVEKALGNDPNHNFEQQKKHWNISLYEGKNGKFWRIQKCAPSIMVAKEIAVKNEIIPMLSFPNSILEEIQAATKYLDKIDEMETVYSDEIEDIATESLDSQNDNLSLSLEEVIDKLVESESLNLNILDKWDMTKKS